MTNIDKYELGRQTLELLIHNMEQINIEKFNEADTRFRFIDKILTECLNWEPRDINLEDVRSLCGL